VWFLHRLTNHFEESDEISPWNGELPIPCMGAATDSHRADFGSSIGLSTEALCAE
jgi:hypothetical protein